MKPILIVLFLSLHFAVSAQTDKRAGAILDAMSNNFKTMTSFRVAFTYLTEGAGVRESLKGDATIKGTKFRLKMAGQEIFNDGKIQTTYIKESNEANISDFDPADAAELNPTKIYTIYKKGYKYVFIEEVKENGATYEVIELSPDNKASKVSKVQVKVNKADKSVKSWKVTQKNGQKLVFRVDKLTPNLRIEDKFFVFDSKLYPGVEVNDLR